MSPCITVVAPAAESVLMMPYPIPVDEPVEVEGGYVSTQTAAIK